MSAFAGNLKRFAQVRNGTTPASGDPDYWSGDVLWATPEDLGKLSGTTIDSTRRTVTELAVTEVNLSRVPAGSLLLSTRAPIGHMGIAGKAMVFNQGCRSIVPGPNLDSHFCYYLLASRVDELNARANGTTFKELARDQLAALPVSLPDLDTQRRIAGYLDDKTARIDVLIAKKRALLDRLVEKRQTLITRAVTRGLNPDAPLKDSGIDWLGKVPAHWEVKPVKRVAKLQSGHTPDKQQDEYWNGEIPWVSLNDTAAIRSGDYIEETAFSITTEGIANSSARLLPARAVVFTRDATIGEAAITTRPMAVSQHIIAWLCSEEVLAPEFLLFVIYGMRGELMRITNGTTIGTIGMGDVKTIRIALPPHDEQTDIIAYVSERKARAEHVMRRVEASIEKLVEYRAALVTAAVTGKIKALLTEDAPKSAKKEAPTAFKRSVLAAYIADTLCDQPTFGRVKFQKLLHLCEAHLEIKEVAGNYHRDAAGPFDTQMMRSVHSQIDKQGWIAPVKGDKGWTYARGEKVDSYRDHFDRYFGNRKEALEDLLALIAPMKTQQAEIVSTAFAAWNDLLLEGKTPSDDEIVNLILNDWTESKRQISSDRWHGALAWMREKGLTPRGLGEHTKRKS
ncbi:restriction endonuclease subunit S [Phaeobacter sp. HS012]|uniref:restriction endonuclease subunit S n=1 Tax=unclassified Phaeobacter TaxID=2621772 RepID=UPI001B3653B7|nr:MULTISPECIES: restriction endonuclease subunit S [unclassified Phaeobacter]MBQ4808096.1 restriction endonuclease subunit S [Phaeobacter sp. HS012]MBQ4882945.1 restriction endonuclease subunit S [Phaeobacter sp. HS011]